MKCPKCSSDNTQRLQVVYEHGTQIIRTTSSTVGGGYGGAFGVGTAHTTTQGAAQSTMAQKSAPPAKKQISWLIILILIGLLCLLGGAGWKFFGVAICVASAYGIHLATTFNKEQWPALYKTWEESWVCNKCGHFYHLPA